ncbi:MAG: SusD/RagB family nutrient-binding outer membrane lipoprotein [Ferruginibacter sp.]
MKNKIFKYFLVSTTAILLCSCSKKIDDVYQNPNAPTRVPVEALLPHIIASMAANAEGHGTMNDIRYVGAYVQNFQYAASLSVFDEMGYNNSDVAQSTWRMHYYDIGQNNVMMIRWAEEEKKWDYAGVGQAIFAWSWLTLVDYYGEVIVKEAFNTDQITFKYDTEETAYNLVRDLCFQSLENLNKTGDNVSQANLAKGDQYFYNGDAGKWKKFVYSVLARYYNHQSNKATYKADSVIYYANLAITNNADNAMVKFAATAISGTNSFFGTFRGNLAGASTASPTAIRQGAYIANLENGTNTAFSGEQDPRAWYLLRGNTAGTIKGILPNKGQIASLPIATDRPESFYGVSQNSTSVVNTIPSTDAACRFIFRNDAPFPIITASEVLFMKSEAAFRKGDKTLALQAYTQAIDQSFDMLSTTFNVNIPVGKEITAANKMAYMSSIVPGSVAGLNLTKIMLQKYIHMFAHGVLETWLDMRRYHYTDLDPLTGQQVYKDLVVPSGSDLFIDNAGKLVYRMRPRFNSEYVWNILELQRIGATTNDYHTKPLWVVTP